MAQATDKNPPHQDYEVRIEISKTSRGISIVVVVGTLLTLGLITIYLLLGAAGLLSEYEATTWEALVSVARVLFFLVIGSFLFLFLRPWIEGLLHTWLGRWRNQDWYRPVALVVVAAVGALAGFGLSTALVDVNYSRPADLQSAVERAVEAAVNAAVSAVPNAASEPSIATASQGAGDADATTPPSTASRGSAVAAAVRSNVAAATRSAAALAIRSRVGTDAAVSRTADAAVDAAVNAGIDANAGPRLKTEVESGIRAHIAEANAIAEKRRTDQTSPREKAEWFIGVCLAFVVFGPRELRKLVEPSKPGPADPTLSLYLGLVLGMIVFLVSS
jgi:hypothetical protein